MKKRVLLTVALVLTLMLFAASVICVAAEATTEDEAPTTDAEYVNPTLLGRAWDFAVENKAEILTVLGDLLGLGLLFLARKKLSAVDTNTTNTSKSSKSMVSAMNGMIDGYNAMKQSYDQSGAAEAERNRLMSVIAAQNDATLKILTTVYANSKLPQGVKDLVSLTYADCLKTVAATEDAAKEETEG